MRLTTVGTYFILAWQRAFLVQEGREVAKRSRSPNYPALNLEDAIDGIKKVYAAEGNRRTSGEDVAAALGHQSLSGAARVKVSALRKYGLLEAEEDGLKVSDWALSLINLPADHPDSVEALQTAALSPVLFAEIHETYGSTPPSDGVLRNYLLKKDFGHKVADDVIRLYRETVNFVSQNSRHPDTEEENAVDPIPGNDESQEHRGGSSSANKAEVKPREADADPPISEQQYRLSEDCEVSLTFSGILTQEALGTLEEYLKIFRKTLPQHKDLPGSSARGRGEELASGDAEVISSSKEQGAL